MTRRRAEPAFWEAPRPLPTRRVYHYLPLRWGLRTLWEKRLKITEHHELNDPFELLPYARTKATGKRFEALAKKMDARRRGLLCFSSDWRIPQMWAQYADKHAGLCLGFDVPVELLRDVSYIDEPLIDHEGARARDLVHGGIKSGTWKHEQEVRRDVRLGEPVGGIHLRSFDDTLCLREVIIGARASVGLDELVSAVSNPPLDVEIYAATVAPDAFAICKHELIETHTATGFRAGLAALPDVVVGIDD